MRLRIAFLLIAASGLVTGAGPNAQAQEEAPQTAAPAESVETTAPAEVDPKAQELLSSAMQFMQGLDRLAVEMNLSLDMKQGEQAVQRALEGEIRLAGDERLYLVSKNDDTETRLISDGETLTVYDVTQNTYFTRDAPLRKQLVGMMGDELTRLGSAFVSAFLHNDTEMFAQATAVSYAGAEEVAGTQTDKVQMQFPDFELTAWIESGDKPLLQRLTIDLSQAMQSALNIEDARAVVDANLSEWQLEPEFETALFDFAPPEGATEEDPSTQQEGTKGLVGRAAPEFSLELLDGGEMSLAEHKGEDIVVLDFWATWCGPCRKGLPIVSEVVDEFKDKNVVFYSVNLEEAPEKIRQFLDALDLDIPVALDVSGDAQQKYRASSIPTTVIVGKDGNVQAVHTGIGPTTEEDLHEQLTTLTEGGSLI